MGWAANYRECDGNHWYHYNRQIAMLIRNMRPPVLSTPCTITPYEPCTLGFLVSDYLDHMKHHLKLWPIVSRNRERHNDTMQFVASVGF